MEIIERLKDIFGLSLIKTEDVNLTLGAIIALILAFIITSYFLKLVRKFITRNLPPEDKNKFV
ncbi:MAG: mechanosensitive ion channel protein MscS, partial [Flavobacterium sp.]|nr:mechanosensitive ion channel protein MscS [Flavobacterium sp.]